MKGVHEVFIFPEHLLLELIRQRLQARRHQVTERTVFPVGTATRTNRYQMKVVFLWYSAGIPAMYRIEWSEVWLTSLRYQRLRTITGSDPVVLRICFGCRIEIRLLRVPTYQIG